MGIEGSDTTSQVATGVSPNASPSIPEGTPEWAKPLFAQIEKIGKIESEFSGYKNLTNAELAKLRKRDSEATQQISTSEQSQAKPETNPAKIAAQLVQMQLKLQTLLSDAHPGVRDKALEAINGGADINSVVMLVETLKSGFALASGREIPNGAGAPSTTGSESHIQMSSGNAASAASRTSGSAALPRTQEAYAKLPRKDRDEIGRLFPDFEPWRLPAK